MNAFNNSSMDETDCSTDPSYHDHYLAKAALGILYGLVFMTAVCGNTLVIYVVATNKSMQSVTNVFITNLALSDIVVNFTSLWLTPVYSYLGRWVWGSVMCHLVPLFQGMSTFISALTLMAIAIDRYVAILYPFRARTSLTVCCTIVVSIWLVGLLLVMPLAVQMDLRYYEDCQLYICREDWDGFPKLRVVYGFVVLSLQFGVPFVVIAYCYIRIWIHLMYRRSMVVSTARSASDERRRRRLLKMLVAMVVIYLLAWLPVNSLNVLRDAAEIDRRDYFVILFLFAHLSSMSASCWNPIVYAWMNDNFRREFKAVLPCFRNAERFHGRSFSITNNAANHHGHHGHGGSTQRSLLANTGGVVSSPSMITYKEPPSNAVSADSASGGVLPQSPRLKLQSVTDHHGSFDTKENLNDPAAATLKQRNNRRFNSSSPPEKNHDRRESSADRESPRHRRSPTAAIMALLTTPNRSTTTTATAAARIAARRPTGKRVRNSKPRHNSGGSESDSPGDGKCLSPRRVVLEKMTAQSINGGVHNGVHCDDAKAFVRDSSPSERAELISVQTTL